MGQLGFSRSIVSLALAVVVATSLVEGGGLAAAQPAADQGITCALEGGQALLTDEQQIRDACASSGPAARAGTPDGYKLWHPGYVRPGGFLYQTDPYPFKQVRIDETGVTTLALINVTYNIYLEGGSSKQWRLSADVQTEENEGNLTSQYSVEYHCGVNLPRASDPTCNEYASDGADPDTDTRVYNPGDQLYKYFGYSNSVTKFPMLKFTVAWSTGITQEYKFRGYDVCVRARTTRFCSGTGGEIDSPL